MDNPNEGAIGCDNATDYLIESESIKSLLKHFRIRLGLQSFELSLSLVSSEEIQDLNKQYRSIDAATDVLSFPQIEWEQALTTEKPYKLNPREGFDALLLGDIVIAPSVAGQNALRIGQRLDREFCFLLLHGLLHLAGHDHKEQEEEKIMLKEQDLHMASLPKNGKLNAWDNCIKEKDLIK